ncbi:hypothetical protein [Apilactobacillus bombintestini]|uniref:Uncharacterized protein n=1 Tax=Apilactobacillus bombintestini TaxID=2419772 RepID=A0A387ARQ5_9LACO|nr:hypothetical protein [Apilactobacillus bombintestini]AYF92141.1 hypothetical protein D7I45_00875 [Apilactobacillus bombintestini]
MSLIHISSYIQEASLVEIYSKSRDEYQYEDFILGIIIMELNDYILVKTYDESALLDTYTLLRKDDISKIATDTDYTSVFEAYIRMNQENDVLDPFNIQQLDNILQLNDFDEIIQAFLVNNRVLTVVTDIDDESHVGRIIDYRGDNIVLDEQQYLRSFGIIDENDNPVISLEDVTLIDLVSKANLLYENYLNQEK